MTFTGAGCTKKLSFDEDTIDKECKIGSAKDTDVALSPSNEVEAHHATLKIAEESPFAEPTSLFRMENLSRYGVLIKRKELVMEPNTMEIFQFENLLVQIEMSKKIYASWKMSEKHEARKV